MNKGIMTVVLGYATLYCMYAAASQCELRKVFHHRVENDNKALLLELGSIVLYCDKYPTVEETSSKDNKDWVCATFLLSHITVLPAAQAMINDFNTLAPELYKARIAANVKHRGIELIIEYNPAKVLLSYDQFEAITRDKGIIFRIYNQGLLKAIKAKEARMLKVSYAKPTIIIDCGHGGSDTGTIGVSQRSEKDVVLAIGKQLEAKLVNAGFKVCMIRDKDAFVPLDERTTQANKHGNSSLFISLHANYASSNGTSGIETYCLNQSLFNDVGLATSMDVLIAPLKDDFYTLSQSLAQTVHVTMINEMRRLYPDIADRKVKNAVAQVLVGTIMPATLIELGFLSHPEEARRLNSTNYQEALSESLCRGIQNFVVAHS